MANLLSTIITGGSGTTPTLVLDRNIATPSNYYNGLQFEVRATSGTAGIGLHRNGYSHVGIYHDSTNELKFNMNSGTPVLLASTGTIWGSGNDGSGSGLDADLLDGIESSRIVYGGVSSRQGVTQISDWNQTAFPNAAFLSSESSTANAPTTDYTYGLQTSFHRNGPEYRTQFVTSLYGNNVYWLRQFRDSAAWSPWVQVIHSGNIGAQSVSYAASAGVVGTADYAVTAGDASSVGGYTFDQGLRTGNSPTFANVYASEWFRNYGNQGIYNQTYGTHFYSNGSGSWGITGSGGAVELQFRSNHQSTLRGYIYADTSNNIGFLSEDGNWVLRTFNRGVEAYGSMRAPIFYDSNDTGYYLDPNGTSNLIQLTTDTRARWNMPRVWYDRSSRTSDQGYWTGTNGWGTGDGTWATAWKGGFSGWDIWGTGTDHPQGGGYIHAQGIVSGQHAASSDGSSGYGWMMVGAANATENRYWLRGKWGGTTSGWVEMITTGNIGSQSVSYASSAGSVAWSNVTSKPSLDYQQEYTFTAPASNDGSGYSWVRVAMGGFNGGGDFVRFSINRAIYWNDANPYGGPSMDVVAYSREWHGGQEGAVITYAEHGSVPGSGWITHAGPRDLAGGGYWFYMRVWERVDYVMRVYRGSGPIGTNWEPTSDPGSIFPIRLGVNNIGAQHTGFNTNGAVHASTYYDYDDTGYYLNPSSESKLRKIWINNGGSGGVGWSTGLNMGDGSNYWNLIQDAGIARQRNYGTGGFDWFNNVGSQIMVLNNAGSLTVVGDVTAYSDARIKTDVKTIENALDKTLKLRGVTYKRTDSEDKSTKVGVIAQEVFEVIPEVVNQNSDGMYSVSYSNLTAVLIEAIKEQQSQINELKAKLDGLTK